MRCGTALARRACRDGLFAAGPVERFRLSSRRCLAIRGALRPYVEFISESWHREYESWRLRVGLDLGPQAGDEHIHGAFRGFRATAGDGVPGLVARQYPARAVDECGQQRGLGAGQPHFPAVAIDKGMAGQVELAVPDFYRRWESFIALAPWRRRWLAEPIEQLLLIQSVFRKCICPLKRMARSDDLVGSVPHQDRCWNLAASLLPQAGQVSTMHDDCRLDVITRSELKRSLLVPGEFGAITSAMQHARNSSSELNLLRYN